MNLHTIKFQISLLIGADFYWDFVEEQIKRRGANRREVESWVFTFRVYTTDTETTKNLRYVQHFDTAQS